MDICKKLKEICENEPVIFVGATELKPVENGFPFRYTCGRHVSVIHLSGEVDPLVKKVAFTSLKLREGVEIVNLDYLPEERHLKSVPIDKKLNQWVPNILEFTDGPPVEIVINSDDIPVFSPSPSMCLRITFATNKILNFDHHVYPIGSSITVEVGNGITQRVHGLQMDLGDGIETEFTFSHGLFYMVKTSEAKWNSYECLSEALEVVKRVMA